MISDNLVTAHAHNVIILHGATVNINPVSAPASENLCFENFSPGPTMVGPIVETGYERMFNTLKVSNTTNDSHVCPLCPHSDR